MRDVSRDSKQALHYRGFVFPRYQGKVTIEEHHSKEPFYSFWGDRYMLARTIRYHVDQMIKTGVIQEAA